MDIKLKPCPFCGGNAVIGGINFVYCENIVNCGAQVELVDHAEHTLKYAIESWNRRQGENDD